MSNMKVEGEPTTRFRIFRSDKDQRNTYELVAEYDTEIEVLAHRWRQDWHHQILENRRPAILEELEKRVWTCELCGQSVIRRPDNALPILPPGYFERCKLRDHMIGDECIAQRDPDTARKLLQE